MKYCCEAFAKEAGRLQAPAGGGYVYPAATRPAAQFELNEDGKTWNINGCCGGGCFVVTGMKFCPFCGNGLLDEQPGGDLWKAADLRDVLEEAVDGDIGEHVLGSGWHEGARAALNRS